MGPSDWGAAWRQQDFNLVKSARISPVLEGAGVCARDMERIGESVAEVKPDGESIGTELLSKWRCFLNSLAFDDCVDFVGVEIL